MHIANILATLLTSLTCTLTHMVDHFSMHMHTHVTCMHKVHACRAPLCAHKLLFTRILKRIHWEAIPVMITCVVVFPRVFNWWVGAQTRSSMCKPEDHLEPKCQHSIFVCACTRCVHSFNLYITCTLF